MSRSYHPNSHVGIETTSARRGEEVVAGKEDQGKHCPLRSRILRTVMSRWCGIPAYMYHGLLPPASVPRKLQYVNVIVLSHVYFGCISFFSLLRGELTVIGRVTGYTRREHMHAGRNGRQQAPSSTPSGKVVSVNQRAPPDRLAARQIRVRDDADGRFNLALGKSAINAILGKRRAEEWLEDQYPLLQKRGRYD